MHDSDKTSGPGFDLGAQGQPDTGLDAFFSAAQEHRLDPGADFLARIEADALDHLPPPAALVAAPKPALPRWKAVLAEIGGWPAAAGLAAACAAGLWVGVVQPSGLEGYWPAASLYSDVSLDPLSGYDMAMLGD